MESTKATMINNTNSDLINIENNQDDKKVLEIK
jgi:hypothetical protein